VKTAYKNGFIHADVEFDMFHRDVTAHAATVLRFVVLTFV